MGRSATRGPIGEGAFESVLGAVLPEGDFVAVIYHAYLDESGTHRGSPAMTMASYIFDERSVRLFCRDWRSELERAGLTAAHMTDCALGFGEYRDMSMRERITVEKNLIKIIRKRSLVGMTISLDHAKFEKVMDGVRFKHSAYTNLLLISVRKMGEWVKKRDPDGRIAFFFESGHDKAKEAHAFMNFIDKNNWDENFRYVSHTFMDKKDLLPLQAADMLAWQHCHYLVRRAQGHKEMRKDFDALVRDQDLFSEIEEEHIYMMRDLLQTSDLIIQRNPDDWPRHLARVFGA